MQECLSESTVLLFSNGRLSDAETERVKQHLDTCASCRALVIAAAQSDAGERATQPGNMVAREVPERFEEYRLLRPLGRGAVGQVYVAQDELLDRLVAIKFLAELRPSAQRRERFLLEGRAIARLEHPNVVAVHRAGEIDGRPFIVSELIRGQSLDRLALPLREGEARRIAIGLARGLAAAHRRGVLHRDLKPANVMIADSGEVKLLDFGLAKLLEEESEPSPPESSSGENPKLTADGVVMGTPLYMPPEAWRRTPITRRSDVYALGAVLYELVSGRPPHLANTVQEVRRLTLREDVAPLATCVPELDARFAAVIDRCLARDPEARYASGDAVREALEALEQGGESTAIEGDPYPGLKAFEAKDRSVFFGREAELRAVIDRLRSDPFVVIAADSGAGKSSLARAGLLPAIEAGAIDGRRFTLVSAIPGSDPLASLIAALAPIVGRSETELARILAADPAELGRILRQHAEKNAPVLLFVDQLEELITAAPPARAHAASIALAGVALGGHTVRLLATARSDYLTRLAALPELGARVPRAIELLGTLSEEGLLRAIAAPLAARGYNFDPPETVERLAAPAAGVAGGLPLLQFALAKLWETRDEARRCVRGDALEALGGVSGALAMHADRVLAAMLPSEREEARRILLALVSEQRTRLRRSARALGIDHPLVASALAALVRGRLLVATPEEGGTAYELAHDVLVTGWETLSLWLAGGEERRAQRHRLERAAQDWDRSGRSPELLWRGRQLAEASLFAGAGAGADVAPLGAIEEAFLRAAKRSARRTQAVRALLVLALPLTALAVYAAGRLEARSTTARAVEARLSAAASALEQARATSREIAELRRDAFAAFDAPDRERAELIWDRALELAPAADAAWAEGTESLEAALVIDGARDDARALLADALFDRVRFARASGAADPRELMERLALYDLGGERRARLHAPASLTIETQPAGAEITIARAAIAPDGRRRFEAPQRFTAGPIAAGSYLLTLTAADRIEVRYPILFAEGESLSLRLPLPRAADVPAGFAFVPEGRFLFGADVDPLIRRSFFRTSPLHVRATGAYLIARSETTMAEWIAYLRALPRTERERQRMMLGTAGTGNESAIELQELANGKFRLRLQPSGTLLVADEGEPLRYPGRRMRAEQDWLRFPAVGVRLEAAEAYVAWLDATGRVPGARLCTELEWERALRGADDRLYPHGDRLDADDANFDETYGRAPESFGPDEVGSHPASRSPFGVDDLAGNAWEWVRPSLTRETALLRGGSYYEDRTTVLGVNREEELYASLHNARLGVRVCATWSKGTTP